MAKIIMLDSPKQLWGRLHLLGAQLKPVFDSLHWDTSTLTLVWQTIRSWWRWSPDGESPCLAWSTREFSTRRGFTAQSLLWQSKPKSSKGAIVYCYWWPTDTLPNEYCEIACSFHFSFFYSKIFKNWNRFLFLFYICQTNTPCLNKTLLHIAILLILPENRLNLMIWPIVLVVNDIKLINPRFLLLGLNYLFMEHKIYHANVHVAIALVLFVDHIHYMYVNIPFSHLK
jgi:hypothetical protein